MSFPEMNNRKVIIFTVVAVSLVALMLISVRNPDTFLPYYITRPSFLVLMMVMYISIVKKPNKLFSVYQLLTVLGEFFQYKLGGLPCTAVIFYTAGAIVLIRVIYSFVNKIKRKEFIAFFLFYIFIFGIIFFGVLDKDTNRIYIIVYGLTFVVLATLVFINFLSKMNLPNLLLLIAIIVETISNEMAVMDIRYALTDEPILIATTLTTLLTHYLFCLGFIYREKESKAKTY